MNDWAKFGLVFGEMLDLWGEGAIARCPECGERPFVCSLGEQEPPIIATSRGLVLRLHCYAGHDYDIGISNWRAPDSGVRAKLRDRMETWTLDYLRDQIHAVDQQLEALRKEYRGRMAQRKASA